MHFLGVANILYALQWKEDSDPDQLDYTLKKSEAEF